jgi:hypothetical protein
MSERLARYHTLPAVEQGSSSSRVYRSPFMVPLAQDNAMLADLLHSYPGKIDNNSIPLYASLHRALLEQEQVKANGQHGYVLGIDLSLAGSNGRNIRLVQPSSIAETFDCLKAFRSAHNTCACLGMTLGHSDLPSVFVTRGLRIPLKINQNLTDADIWEIAHGTYRELGTDIRGPIPCVGGLRLTPHTIQRLLSGEEETLTIKQYALTNLKGAEVDKLSRESLQEPGNRVLTIMSTGFDEPLFQELLYELTRTVCLSTPSGRVS